jgi:prophage regulatory protein
MRQPCESPRSLSGAGHSAILKKPWGNPRGIAMLLSRSKAMSDTLRLLSKKQLKELVLYSHQHIQRLEDAGSFPKRVRLGNHRGSRVGWIESEVRAWLQERIDKRQAAP